MGLSPDVLNKLLITEEARISPNHSPPLQSSNIPIPQADVQHNDEGDILEFEFESDEASPPSMRATPTSSPKRPKRILVDPILDTFEYPHRSSNGLSSSIPAGSSSLSAAHNQRKFRVRLLSESRPETPIPGLEDGEAARPMSVSGMFKDSGIGSAQDASLGVSPGKDGVMEGMGGRGTKVIRRSMNEGNRVKAEYILGGRFVHR